MLSGKNFGDAPLDVKGHNYFVLRLTIESTASLVAMALRQGPFPRTK
jgi:hypothetical protein